MYQGKMFEGWCEELTQAARLSTNAQAKRERSSFAGLRLAVKLMLCLRLQLFT